MKQPDSQTRGQRWLHGGPAYFGGFCGCSCPAEKNLIKPFDF